MAKRVLRQLFFLVTTVMLAACGSGGGGDGGTPNASALPSTATSPAPQSTGTSPAPQSAATSPAPQSTPTSPAPPSTPTSPAPPSTASVTLAWTPNTEPDLAGYKVYRATSSGSYGAAIATLPANTTSFVATGLQPGVTYFFVITAFDSSGNESARSPELRATASL